MTLGALGARHCSGQLTLTAEGKRYAIAFDAGAVIGASSPLPNDSAPRIALVHHIVAPSLVPEITRRIAAAPEREEIDVLADVAGLSLDHKLRLRRKVIEQRAARTFAADTGDFVIDSDIAISVLPGLAIDIRAVIFAGARTVLSEQRLVAELRPLGSHFTLKPDAGAELPFFGFTDEVAPILDGLRSGATLAELEARNRNVDPRVVYGTVYALASCGLCDAIATQRMATLDPGPVRSRAPTSATPSEVYSRTHTGTREVFVSRSPTTPTAVPRTATTGQPPTGNLPAQPSKLTLDLDPPETARGTGQLPPMAAGTMHPRGAAAEPGSRPTAPSQPPPADGKPPTRPPAYVPGPRSSATTAPPSDDGGNTPRALPSRTSTASAPPVPSRTATPGTRPRTSTPPIPRTTPPLGVSRTGSPGAPPLPRSTTPTSVPRTTSPQAAVPAQDSSSKLPAAADSPSDSQPRMSSGTAPPEVSDTRPPGENEWPADPIAAAREAFRRGQSAMRDQTLSEAIIELTKAVQYAPNEVDYQATLTWAKFCAAPDKQVVADVTRKLLGHAISKSQTPEVARFYLGRVERMLGRDREALGHFHEVLMMQPRHADAAAEIRVIEARLASGKDGGGLFGRKR
jgi:hypothetical protein